MIFQYIYACCRLWISPALQTASQFPNIICIFNIFSHSYSGLEAQSLKFLMQFTNSFSIHSSLSQLHIGQSSEVIVKACCKVKNIVFSVKVALFIMLKHYKSYLFVMRDYLYNSSITFDNLFVMLDYLSFQAFHCITYL